MENDQLRDTTGTSATTGGENEEGSLGQESISIRHNLGGSTNISPASEEESVPSSRWNQTLKQILRGLRAEGKEELQLQSLFQLCDLFGTLHLRRGFPAVDSFVHSLVKLLSYEHNPDMMTMAARALTYLCEVVSDASGAVADYGGIPRFCECLLTMEYIDLAEQALQALEKISYECPKDCLVAGVLRAVLLRLDFFSIGFQRLALSTAANICSRLPSDAADYVREAIPTLTNVLGYQDSKMVEYASVCLKLIAERFRQVPENLDILCTYELISQVALAISVRKAVTTMDSQTSFSASTLAGLIRILSICASRSIAAERLILLGIGRILKDIVAEYGLESNASFPPNVMNEIVSLISELLPTMPKSTLSIVSSTSHNSTGDSARQHAYKETGVREKLFLDQPDLLVQFGEDLFPVLVQFYGSSLNVRGQKKCLAAIHKLLHFSSPIFLDSLQKKLNLSSFLAGLLASRDASLLIVTLQMAEILLQKNEAVFSKAFVKEGVSHAVSELLASFQPSQSELKKKIVKAAKDLKERYLCKRLGFSNDGSTVAIRKLKTLGAKLSGEYAEDFTGKSVISATKSFNEDLMGAWMSEILEELQSQEGLSTYEFQESEIVSCLLRYFGVGNVSRNELPAPNISKYQASQRFRQFIEIALPLDGDGEVSLITLVRKLQNALASSDTQEFSAVNGAHHGNRAQYRRGDSEFLSYVELMSGWRGDDVHDIVVGDEEHVESPDTEMICQSFGFSDPTPASGIQRWGNEAAGTEVSWQEESILKSIFEVELPYDLRKKDSPYNIVLVLQILEQLNRLAPRLRTQDCQESFVQSGNVKNLMTGEILGPVVPTEEFLSWKMTSKLGAEIHQALVSGSGKLPAWCHQLMKGCPFLFSFDIRMQYFRSTAFGLHRALQWFQEQKGGHSLAQNHRIGRLPRQKVRISRHKILESAAKVMELYSGQNVVVEVEYFGEVGTGLGPTLEFYTLVSHEFQKSSLDMWRTDSSRDDAADNVEIENAHGRDKDSKRSATGTRYVCAGQGLFPRPWLPGGNTVTNGKYAKVIQHFRLLGRVVAKALQDGRMLDLPLSSAFYKLILGKKLDFHDIAHSIDPELGRTLQEMHILASRKQFLESLGCEGRQAVESLRFRDSTIEDLFLDFTLPGYPNYSLKPGGSEEMVSLETLEEYVSLVVDATLNKGIIEQFEAFRSGFNEVFKLSSLQIFDEDELESLLCGKLQQWKPEALPKLLKFDHGYTASSAPVQHLLEIMGEFTPLEQQQFLFFVTGAPKLPPGGLSALSPKLTIVRRHPSGVTGTGALTTGSSSDTTQADEDLPSVMTCANYLKLPPYSCKEIMRKKIMLALTEGQGSFDLS